MNKTDTSIYDSGVLEEGKEAILRFREGKKKKRKSVYQEVYRERMNRAEIQLTNDEYALITELAKKAGKRRPTFIKECFFAYLESKPMISDNPQLQEIIVLLRRYGNNLNQLVRYYHIEKDLKLDTLNAISVDVQELETKILVLLKVIDQTTS